MGVIGGGLIGQTLYNFRPGLMPLFVGACVSSAAFPIWFLVNADIKRISLFWSFAAAFIGGMLSSPPGPNARLAALQNAELASERFDQNAAFPLLIYYKGMREALPGMSKLQSAIRSTGMLGHGWLCVNLKAPNASICKCKA